MKSNHGKVFLVGAGPGDPELLTIKARRLLDEADVIVYDRLVSGDVLDLVPPGVLKIFVGKAPGNHPAPQDSINDMLVRLARAGHRVVRLKGGDPFVFGRGGEEALHLVRHGIAIGERVPIPAPTGGGPGVFQFDEAQDGIAPIRPFPRDEDLAHLPEK